MSLYLWDDERAAAFEPFALTRPLAEVRAGALLVRERWARALGDAVEGFVAAPHLDAFGEAGAPRAAAPLLPTGTIVANARCLPRLAALLDASATHWCCGGEVAAVRLPHDVTVDELRATRDLAELAPVGEGAPLDGWWLREVWDLVGLLPALLADDLPVLAAELEATELPPQVLAAGPHPVVVERGAAVEPIVFLDATAGPIVVRRGASVAAFTRLVGPCFVDEATMVLGGRIATCSIGPHCKVHGELSNTTFLGYANKGHDGFVGHSVLGRWVNLGAGTITSNLKNTYGPVQLWTPGGVRDTGLQFLGTLFGDHVKTGIGTRLTTGSVLGAGANVFGSAMPPRAVPPFAWGDGAAPARYDLDRFLRTAERAMRRRDVALTDDMRRQLAAAHARGWPAARVGA
ncbi:MAG TPA: putative sugar nucleotidyl transferase [Gemmatimonadaceae bacterium]|nr:putative sugar nucleotidyl transferase [Gemmatimonadaceae bacterium]